MPEPLSILLIEGDPDKISFLTALLNKLQLKEIDLKLQVLPTLHASLQILENSKFDIIITNLYLSDSQGLATFLEIQKKADPIPIIIVGEDSEEELIKEAIRLGAQDSLPKEDLTVELLARMIHHAIERHHLLERLKIFSFTDELTHVYNRRGFITLLEQHISLSRRMQKGFYLFLIDLDRLKLINDTYGHLAGDKALIDTAHCLYTSYRRHDIIGRIGGDEFGVVALDIASEYGEPLRQHLLNNIELYNAQSSEPYHLSLSIGKAYFDPQKEIDFDTLFQQADQDLYAAKRLSHL